MLKKFFSLSTTTFFTVDILSLLLSDTVLSFLLLRFTNSPLLSVWVVLSNSWLSLRFDLITFSLAWGSASLMKHIYTWPWRASVSLRILRMQDSVSCIFYISLLPSIFSRSLPLPYIESFPYIWHRLTVFLDDEFSRYFLASRTQSGS